MNQLKKTIWFIFTYDIEKLVLFSIFMILYIPMHYYNLTRKMLESSELINQILLIYILSVVFGFFIASGLSQLKKSYIYLINKHYQQHLKRIAIIVATVFGLIMVLIYSNNIYISILHFLIVVTVVANINYSRVNRTILADLIIFGFPLFLFLRDKFLLSQNTLLIMTVIHVCLMLFMAYYNYNNSKVISSQTKEGLKETNNELCGGDLNYKLGKVITKFKGFYKGKIDFAISTPVMKLGIFGITFIISLILIYLFYKKGEISIDIVLNILIALYFVFTALGSKNLINQTTKVAHVFRGKNHKQLKNKVLFAIDKILILNISIFLGCIFITAQLLSLPINSEYILISTLALFLFGMASYPMIISADVEPILRILPILAYAVLTILLIFWLYHNLEKAQTFEYAIPYTISCLALRLIAQNLFWETPYEKLVKINYENIK